MSIWHLLNLDTVGGVEELFANFYPYAQDHHVLITGSKLHPFFSISSYTLEKYALGLKLPKFLRRLKRAVTLSNASKIVLWNRIEEIQTKAQVIYYEHGASWILPKSKNSFFSRPDAILANSYAAKRVLELKWGVQQPITVIQNPLKPTLKPGQAKTHKTSFTIGFIGRLIPLKGVSILLHAVKGLPVSLQIAGDGPEKPALEALAKKLSINCNFLGCIKDVASFYDTIDVLVVPSIREPLGLMAQEAQLRGCPVLASYVDGLPEVVPEGFTIKPTLPLSEYTGSLQGMPDLVYNPESDTLCEPKLLDPHLLANKLQALIHDRSAYELASRQAIECALKRPDFPSFATQLNNCLTK